MNKQTNKSKTVHLRLTESETREIKKVAKRLGFVYGDDGSLSKMLKAIIAGDVAIYKSQKIS